jgi:predicted HTH transcriptional regulator
MKKRVLCDECVSKYHFCDKCNDTGWMDIEVDEEPKNKKVLIIHIEESGHNPYYTLEQIAQHIENKYDLRFKDKQVLKVTFSEIVETKEECN